MSPTRRREVAGCLQEGFGASQRRACRVIGQPRSTQRYQAKRRVDEVGLVQRMHEIVRREPRFGYRRIWAVLRREGRKINHKRVDRLCRREGLRVPRKQRKKRRLGCSAQGIIRHRPQSKNHVWAWDFIFDADVRGRSLKWFGLIDEYTRECLALEVERSMRAVDVIDILSQVLLIRGVPGHIRSDNGPEFIAQAIQRYLKAAGIGTLYIEPGSPWENGYEESFFSRLRDELLNAEAFVDLPDAKALAAYWQSNYNHRRPHSSLGYLTPAEFAAQSDSFLGALPPDPRLPPLRGGTPGRLSKDQTLITLGT